MADVTNTKTYFLTQAQYETLRTGGTTEVTDYNGYKKTLTGLPSDGYFVCYYQNIIGPTGPRGFTGAVGDKGDKGDKGDPGATGAYINSVTGNKNPAPGETVTYTMKNSNGTTAGTFQVLNGIKINSVQYQSSSSATTPPTGTWSNSPVAVAENSFLWTRTSFSDGSVAYSVAKQGGKGSTGSAAGFGTPTATVDANIGTPEVTVAATGADTAKVFSFTFKNLKGATGPLGPTGSTWFSGEAVATDTAGNVIQSVTGQIPPVSPKVGDYYLNLSSNDVFRYNESNLWTKVTNFKGAAGRDGTDGVTANVKGVAGNSTTPGVVTGMTYNAGTQRIEYNVQPGSVVFFDRM